MRKREKKAVGLEYSGEGKGPAIVAVARGKLVDRMLAIAEEYNIPVYENPDLAETLSAFPAGSEIPPELYQAVAEVLAYCYRVNENFREKMEFLGIHNV